MLSGVQKHVDCFDQGIKRFCEIYLAALWTLQQNFEFAVVLSLYVCEYQISYLLLLRIFMLHTFVFRCQNCNLYCIINIAKITK